MDYLFIQQNSPDGGFLQSKEWRKFQESVGRKTWNIFYSYSDPLPPFGYSLPQAGEGDLSFWANIIEHNLPVTGRYFYVPRGPVIKNQKLKCKNQNYNLKLKNFFENLINLARKENAGWIRIDAYNMESLDLIKNFQIPLAPFFKGGMIVKAPHDMQPREILMMDITKPEEQLLAEMKAKTRYNIRLAEKKGISLRITNSYETTNKKDVEEFLRLVKITAKRDKISSHPESYYRKMFETIPPEILKLYVAEYEGKIIAANIMIFFGDTATYLHGASDNNYRNVMAPYLLQWRAIQDAKKTGCTRYDFGGIRISQLATRNLQLKKKKRVSSFKFQVSRNDWRGITKFKIGFAPNTKPITFPGSYDIILNLFQYKLYRMLQKIKQYLNRIL